jgi:intermediate peptidase
MLRRFITTASKRQPTPLQLVFDSPSYWKSNYPSTSESGLFSYSDLKTPECWDRIVQNRIVAADSLVALVTSSTFPSPLTVKRLDRLSDIICCVVDTAEVIRHVHPCKKMAQAADSAHNVLSNYLNRLNTHTGLYNVTFFFLTKKALVATYEDPVINLGMSDQEKRVAKLLIMDFKQSGIHMPEEKRARFVELNDHVARLGQEFIRNSYGTAVPFVKIKDPYQALEGLSLRVIESVSSRGARTAAIPIGHNVSHYILRSCKDEDVRRRIYVALNSGSAGQIKVLEDMLGKRDELAKLLGRESFSDMHLMDKMAKNPGLM